MIQGRKMLNTVKIRFSYITIIFFIVASTLLSTGTCHPTTQIFLWDWLTFSSNHILVPILTIIFIPLGIECLQRLYTFLHKCFDATFHQMLSRSLYEIKKDEN